MVRTGWLLLVVLSCFLVEESMQDSVACLIGLEAKLQKLNADLILPHIAA
jgi:hypothetical protein